MSCYQETEYGQTDVNTMIRYSDSHLAIISVQQAGANLLLYTVRQTRAEPMFSFLVFWIHLYAGACIYDKNRSAMANYVIWGGKRW